MAIKNGPAPHWAWGDGLARRFDTHAAAHIPMYAESHALTVELSDWHVTPGSKVYDLGSSTGTLAMMLGERHPHARVVGVDAEDEMTRVARGRCTMANVRFETANVLELPLQECSYVTACHLTPFLRNRDRTALFAAVHEALLAHGAFVLFEKSAPADAESAAIASSVLTSYKLAHGVDAATVVVKEQALRGVMSLRPPAETEHALLEAGFWKVTSIMRWMNWDGFLAVKAGA